jgi:hypothetical protein
MLTSTSLFTFAISSQWKVVARMEQRNHSCKSHYISYWTPLPVVQLSSIRLKQISDNSSADSIVTDEVILGVVVGASIGWGFRHLMKFCQHNDFVDRQSYIAQYISWLYSLSAS